MGEIKKILGDTDVQELKELCMVVLNAPSEDHQMTDYQMNAAADVYITWVELEGQEAVEKLKKTFGGHIPIDRFDEYRMRLMDLHYEWLNSMIE